MKQPLLLFCSLLSIFILAGCRSDSGNDGATDMERSRQSFNRGWCFFLGDAPGAEKPALNDSGWRALDLPHDWSIEGRFDPANPSGGAGGYLPCGIGWYRKSFELGEEARGRRVFIEFDGVHMNSEVWINGHYLGKRPYGYSSFGYDLTHHLNEGGENVIAVRVDNSLQPASRWYTGSGIYRHVWLTITDKLHVAHWGTQVSTPEISPEEAIVAIQTTVRNGHPKARDVTVVQTILDAGGQEVDTTRDTIRLPGDGELTASQELAIANPLLWSPDEPNLYRIHTEILDGERRADQYETPLGVREFHFDAAEGLFLNGESIIMKGVCNHHDLGPLGAALWTEALERRLRMLKEMGCNAIRTAHNIPSPQLLEMCDRLGFLVINETFDEWRRGWDFEDGTLVASKEPKGKAKYGYNRYFDEWAERDLTDHIRRDRNHPSVILWSVGNEVPEAQKYGEVETLKKLRDICHALDPTRPMTVGCNFIAGANESGFTEFMDVVGYNGGGGSCFQYEQDHKQFPDRKIYASEVPHSFQTRGEYRTRSVYREPEHQPPHLTEEEVFPETSGYYASSYDNAGVRISAIDSWRLTSSFPFVAGEFRWTGFDYLGESGGWPRVLRNFGIIDICDFPKDHYYFYQSVWTTEPMVHILPHWNWPGKEGVTIPVWAYTNAEEVELFLNGRSLGVRRFNEEFDFHLQWMVPYEPGELKAVARQGGKEVASKVVRTAGAVAGFELSVDQEQLGRGSRELSYVTIRTVDEEGVFEPTAETWTTLAIKGPGRIVAVGNGDPLSHHPFQCSSVRTFNGLARVIISADQAEPGEVEDAEIVLTVRSLGLPSAEIRIGTAASR